ncbi:unnamed protein product [Rhizophagus irregularis]|nr:unnamed protein product [Rhizophagus irregularis]
MGSSLICRKRKTNEIDDEYDMDKVLRTVIDAEKWYFMECTLDEERKPSFKLSEPVIVEYNDENMQIKVKKSSGILYGYEASQSGEGSREIKRVKSSSNLAGKSDIIVKS